MPRWSSLRCPLPGKPERAVGLFGNNLLSCRLGDVVDGDMCAAVRNGNAASDLNNNNWTMVHVDADGSPFPTFNWSTRYHHCGRRHHQSGRSADAARNRARDGDLDRARDVATNHGDEGGGGGQFTPGGRRLGRGPSSLPGW